VLVIGSKYAYSFGRVRALEAQLLDKTQFKRMAEAKTASEVIKILSETVYAIPEGADVPVIEKALQKELYNVYDLAQHISPQKSITDLIQMKYDFHNAKVILKAEILSRKPVHLMPLGVVDIEKLKKAFKERIKDLPAVLADAVEKARAAYEETGDTQVIDFVMDAEYVAAVLEHCEDPFLKEFFRFTVDLENIKNVIRCQRFDIDFEKAYIDGGTIDVKTFLSFKGEPVETIIAAVQTRKYSHIVEEGLKNYEETKTLTVYEKRTDDFLIEYLKKAKMAALTIEPLIGYILAKEQEVKQVRLVLLGKLKGIDVEKRMSDPYV
jgi:V/A-type H+-transporting ATPase subunit C